MVDTRRGDRLVELIARGTNTGPEAYELLQLVFAGYPVERLRPLLESREHEVVQTGVSILAESAASTGLLPGLVDGLLLHEDAKVRYYAVQAVLGSGSAIYGETAAHAAELINDRSRPVRRSVVRFLAGAPDAQLVAMLPHLGDEWRERISLLIASRNDDSFVPAMLRKLDHPGIERFIGLAAAIRRAELDPRPLETAAQSTDPEVREFASHEIDVLHARRAGWPGDQQK